jgi:adenylate cyclase
VSSIGDPYSWGEVSILLADLRGFAAIAESYPARVVLDTLNRCFASLTEVIVQHYGTIDKFMGDAIMVVFPGDQAAAHDHARRAILCAVQMQIAMDELREKHRADNVPEMFLGIGVNTGKVMTGLIGSDLYRAHTVIGDEVNLASRIEAFSLRGQVLMSESTYTHCRDFVQAGEPMDVYVKGRSERLRIREALGIPELGKLVPRQEMRKSPRVEVDMALQYQPLLGKMVESRPLMGRMRDLGYHGALAQFIAPLPLHSEVKLAFDLASLGFRAEEIYARVVSVREQAGRHLAGLEFTSLGDATHSKIRLFVQMRIQGE